MLGLLGKKKGMTQIFDEKGDAVPVTVIELGPCTVVQKKTLETDGYNALQIGYKICKPRNMAKPLRGHFEKKGVPLFTHLKEFRTDAVEGFKPGDELLVSGFKAGDKVNVSGVTKGRGFQGVIKRHGKSGGPAAHGSGFRRRPGSIGMRTFPSRVFKNMKLPGHMGDVSVTVKNLEVVSVREDDNVILVKGGIPGSRECIVEVVPVGGWLESRPELKRAMEKTSEPADEISAEDKVVESVPDASVKEETKEGAKEETKE